MAYPREVTVCWIKEGWNRVVVWGNYWFLFFSEGWWGRKEGVFFFGAGLCSVNFYLKKKISIAYKQPFSFYFFFFFC